MKVTRASELQFVPASHEDARAPSAFKRVLFTKGDFCPGQVQMVNWALLPAGKSFRRHLHQDMDEMFLVINGQAKMEIGAEQITLSAGDGVIVPLGTPHTMTALNDDVQYIVMGVALGHNGKTVVV